ncbi:flavin monoamine oxidase family protein [Pseudomonas orientalis]|uniref:flavin monoamine oxidase family protein n=2 Tax=Pseudomonas orientalis TaxID=76758 RepID=UPI000ABD077B|nr:flavin monoamine oxidase family protein [Pseudomonas orientalis]
MDDNHTISRRRVLSWIGNTAGASAMYQALNSLAFASESNYDSDFSLSGGGAGTKVIILGAGLSGMTAAYELRKAGYCVKILEYRPVAGGRSWTIRGGDQILELGGEKQLCKFDSGLYFNPGPWRIPYHHYAMLSYCKGFGVKLEPFIQVNHNTLLHSAAAFGGVPQSMREVQADFHGNISELLSKSIDQKGLDDDLSLEDRQKLLEALRAWGGLDKSAQYKKSLESSLRRGFSIQPGGGLMPQAQYSETLEKGALLNSGLWRFLLDGGAYEFQPTLFQPTGGMDMLAHAFAKRLPGLIQYNANIKSIHQNSNGVEITWQSTRSPNSTQTELADWCICTLPLSILNKIPNNFSSRLSAAIQAVPYAPSVKIGLQFNRRFWESDNHIYGGISYTDLPISKISYPSCDYGATGKGILLGGYIWGPNAYEFSAMSGAQRIEKALYYGSKLHPQYLAEFDSGVSVSWHRNPWTNGCYGQWSNELRAKHYDAICDIDNRVVLAGEHASYIPAWQEGAILSALDCVKRLHTKILSGS